MRIDVKLYKEVSDLINEARLPYRSLIDNLNRYISTRYIEFTKLYHILSLLRSLDKINYLNIASEAVKTVINSQISEGDTVIHKDDFYGVKVKGEASTFIEGGLPDLLEKGEKIIRGETPSIISTCASLEILIEYSIETQYWDDDIDNTLRNGYKYLLLRDLNRDGLLEQDPKEDWIYLLRRGGATLSSNSIFLKFLEDMYYLYIDKDREFGEEIKRRYLRLYRDIEGYFWLDGFYADYISEAFNIFYRSTIDTSLIGRPIISREGDKLYNHFRNTLDKLIVNGVILATEDRVRISPEYRLRGYIASTYHSTIYVYDILQNGFLDLALRALKYIIPNHRYSYIIFREDGMVKRLKSRDSNQELLLLLTYKKFEDMVRGGGEHQLA